MPVRKTLRLAGTCLLMGLLAACADDPMAAHSSLMPVQASAVDPDPAALRLAHAAEEASEALVRLSRIEAFRTPMPNDAGADIEDPALQQPVTMTWTGPIEQITRTLAEMGGYTFKIISNPPPVPLVVGVNAYQQPIAAVLRDIGFQAGRRADVIVDLGNQAIHLRFAPTDGVLRY